MEFSETIGKIAPAMAKAWGDTPTPKHNKEVTVQTKSGRDYKFNYTTLAGILDAIREPFKANGLFVVQDVKTEKLENSNDNILTIKTFIYHASGEYMSGGQLTVKASYDMQSLGGQITYLKRYSLSSVLGLATEQDDDGNSPEALAGYTSQDGNQGNQQNGGKNQQNGNKGKNTQGNNKNAASGQQSGKNTQPTDNAPKKDEPKPMDAEQKAILEKQVKAISHTIMIPEKDVWPRLQALYKKPGKAVIPNLDDLTAKWADHLITVLEDHVAGKDLPAPQPPKQEEKGAGKNEDAKQPAPGK